MTDIPKIISVDDHVVEPADVWQKRLPKKYLDVGPRVERAPLGEMTFVGGNFSYAKGEGNPCDWWHYEDKKIPQTRLSAAVGFDRDEVKITAITYEEMRPGCYDPKARLEDMDVNWVEASLSFPTFPRFCGQTFMEAKDMELADLCVKAYNDWMFDEWCGGSNGRLIPLPIIQLWDSQLAADEIRRNAARGGHAVAFTEIPPFLGLPSVHDPDGYWDPFFEACAETDTVVCMHIGSSSRMPSTSDDAPPAVGSTLTYMNAAMSLTDYLMSGVFEKFPDLKIAYSRRPDRLDPVRARARRRGVGPQPGVGRCRRQGEEAAQPVLPGARLRLLLRRPARPALARGHRRRHDHVRDRLPAQRLHVAEQSRRSPSGR